MRWEISKEVLPTPQHRVVHRGSNLAGSLLLRTDPLRSFRMQTVRSWRPPPVLGGVR